MDAHKINLKFFMKAGQHTDPETWFEIFNTWIPDTPDEVLIDVADYSHVHNGPVTLLVGFEANYSIDNNKGRQGLQYDRKRPIEGSTAQQIGRALLKAIAVCRRIEEEPKLDGAVRFLGNEILVTLNDRLNAPNTSETLGAFKSHLDAVLKVLYKGSGYSVEHLADPKERFTLVVKSEGDPEMVDLMENLDGVF
jgi:hypothetical protein